MPSPGRIYYERFRERFNGIVGTDVLAAWDDLGIHYQDEWEAAAMRAGV